MGNKKRGHYCLACGDYLANEKFGGTGHGKHLCKDCKRKGRKVYSESNSDYDRELHRLSKAIRNCMILYTEDGNFFLFEYQRSRYIIRNDFDSDIFVYQEKTEQKFFISEALQKNKVLMEVLYKKYYDTMENGYTLDYEEVLEDGSLKISKKRRQHLDVILSLQHLR
ncbi:hypothetical protein GMB86_00140 [Terrilactibacillus sp. BCM23-1]|uniref:Uncharacterized protein n=1 Tax=Terrilactibacillus tamarindi TaxID=2599694 RepID=A0A6N8CL44_9BACI|nr:hypothetical protein [Terrilactibacillus tamarindi]MTT30421.1 hypothetical protein [Terrilactibacillus tamarindi]